MTGRLRPPYLRLVGNDGTEPNHVGTVRNDAPTIADIAVAPLVDAGRAMINSAVDAAVDAAADFGLDTDPDRLRREIRVAVTRYVDSWIVSTLTENGDVDAY